MAVQAVVRPDLDTPLAGDDSVLTSKITVPALPSWLVPRPRINDAISRGIQGPITVITGPPGAGKTLAMASWSTSRTRGPAPPAWLSVDRYDNSPETFWRHLTAALTRAGAPVHWTGPTCASEGSASRDFLAQLALAAATREHPVVLALDDVHVLANRRPLADLAYVLEHAGNGLRLLVASRTGPLMPLHPFRLSGQLAEIRAGDLAFTSREAGQLMVRYGITLSPPALETLASRTEGWAAGLRLAALAMRDHPDPDQAVQAVDAEDSTILDYLVDEVFDTQPASARDLLMRTSILERVNDELAAELTGDRRAAGMLPALAEANGFIEPLGHGWYRYHSLFADVLRVMVKRDGRYDLAELRRRATLALARQAGAHQPGLTPPAATEVRLAPRQRRSEMPAAESTAPVVTEPLSQREREVLEYVSSMLNTAEIADELYLSVNTVKSHLRSIFRKLGASRRGEAVRRARELQLL